MSPSFQELLLVMRGKTLKRTLAPTAPTLKRRLGWIKSCVLAGMEQQVRQMASKDFLVRECTLSARSDLLPIHENESDAQQQTTAPAVVSIKALRPISYVCGCPRGLHGRRVLPPRAVARLVIAINHEALGTRHAAPLLGRHRGTGSHGGRVRSRG